MRILKIGKKLVGEGKPCFVIAEAGSNHNGDFGIAKKLIAAAAMAGADAIKFQLFRAEALSSDKKAQKILEKYEFNRDWLPSLNKYAESKGVIFCATPFDKEAVDLLAEAKVPFFKIASGDLTHFPLIDYIAKKHRPVILSVGLANMNEIRKTLNLIYSADNRKVALLHCIASYPSEIGDLNLKVIHALRQKFKIPVGFSDHSMDTFIPSIAVSLGGCIVEKHFTLSRKMKGPDHFFALEPGEFKTMVDNIRKTEKSMGSHVKKVVFSERRGVIGGRRSLYAKIRISKGTIVTEDSIAILRPQKGIVPKYLYKVIGRRVKKDIYPFNSILWKDLNLR